MADNVGIYEISAGLHATVSSSLHVSGNLNVRRGGERGLYSRLAAGIALRSDVGEAPSPVIVNPTPPFVLSSSVLSYGDQLATPPSWTQRGVGLPHDQVIHALSSSQHEVSRMNAFHSSTIDLESSAVPARGQLFYSKGSRLTKRIYKLSASVDLPVVPAEIENFPYASGSGIWEADIFNLSRGIWDDTSGSYRSYTYFNPAVFEIFVPDYGKIRDVKVWVELVHDLRRVSGTVTGQGNNFYYGYSNGLQGLQIALRSPNVTFRSAHPVWNDPQTFNFKNRHADWMSELTGSSNQFGSKYYEIPELLRSSYLLWEGLALSDDDRFAPFVDPENPGSERTLYSSYNGDMDMRTIFTDSSAVVNPRNIESSYTASIDLDPGEFTLITSSGDSFDHPIFFSQSAPNVLAWTIASSSFIRTTQFPAGVLPPSPYGRRVPWFMDSRLSSGAIAHRSVLLNNGIVSGAWSADSPPPGWLTGPAGAASVGEFSTSGFNVGPVNIQPAYPLLDDVYGRGVCNILSGTGQVNRDCTGFRPGLRGTEIYGKWQLLVGTSHAFDNVFGMQAQPQSGFWFRQFRLEFIVDQGIGDQSMYPSKERRFRKPGYVATRPGKRKLHFYFGSTVWEIGARVLFTEVKPEYGRSVGITDQTGSNPDDLAVFTRMTGALADSLTGTLVPFTFLHNEFGTPYIPISSGSGIPLSFQVFSPEDATSAKAITSEVIKPKTTINRNNTVRAHISRARVTKTTRDDIFERLQAILISS